MKARFLATRFLSILAVICFTLSAGAKENAKFKRVEFTGTLQNLVIVRTDSDFDRTKPLYNVDRQGVGAIATIFSPAIKINITKDLFVFYQAELGLNYWSKNNPDQENTLSSSVFVLKHRQVFVEGLVLNRSMEFKVGYQYLTDPTGLFVNHWIGAAKMGWHGREHSVGVIFAQFPDAQWEGITIDKNNFQHDISMGGVYYKGSVGDWRFRAWGVALYDAHIPGKEVILGIPSLSVSWQSKYSGITLAALMQAGIQRKGAIDGSDANMLSYAAQVNAWWQYKGLKITVNMFTLGADDSQKGNGFRGGMLYSGKNRSATMYLTEDETRDWYDNIDERVGSLDGPFFSMRPGLFVGDLAIRYEFLDWLAVRGVIGSSMVTNPDNALGSRYVGTEGDLQVLFGHAPLSASITIGAVGPGKAGAALVNHIDKTATKPVVYVEASLNVRF